MTTQQTQKGFTLVELAIVMTIIGLLIGGILKGQELMSNARVTATIAQVRSIEAATTTFRDKYDAVPGDMAAAGTRIVGCTAACNPAAAGAGDGVIGAAAWAGTSQHAGTSETYLFWTHLARADLLAGVTPLGGATYGAGGGYPATKLSSAAGFVVGTAAPATAVAPYAAGISGTVLAISSAVPSAGLAAAAMTNLQAANIDRKMDDGMPGTGYVVSNCNTGAGATYAEGTAGNVCGLLLRIQ